MEPNRWQKVKELFGAALERPSAERAPFLAQACGSDPGLRAEVESLLAAHQDSSSTPASGVSAAQAVRTAEDTIPGRRIGPYQVLHRIGVGGMAAVYVAVRC